MIRPTHCGECPPDLGCGNGGDPDSFKNFIDAEQTHANAGILNLQNYLLARDASPPCMIHDQVEVCSIGSSSAEELHYYVLQHDFMDHSADLLDYEYALQAGAIELYGVPSTELTNTMHSLRAVGLWTKDYPASTVNDINGAPDVAFFSETGSNMYMFYKKRSSNHILYRKYEGSSASWGDALDLTSIYSGAVTDADPSIVEYGGKLYVFFKKDGLQDVYYVKMNSDGTFQGRPVSVPDGSCTYATETNDRVAVAEFDGDLYMVFRAPNNYMRYRKFDASGWNACATTTGNRTYASPSAIGNWQGRLWVGHVDVDTKARLLKIDAGGQMSVISVPDVVDAARGIEVEVFKDELHVSTVNDVGEIRYHVCSPPCSNASTYPTAGAHWSRLVEQHGGSLFRTAMTDFMDGARLVMMVRDQTTGVPAFRYKTSE